MLIQEERLGTAISYNFSYLSIKKFKGNCHFTEITKSFLIQYEQWMLKKGRSESTWHNVAFNYKVFEVKINISLRAVNYIEKTHDYNIITKDQNFLQYKYHQAG